MAEKDLNALFGMSVKKARTEKKLTQEQLSEMVGVTDNYIRAIEHGRHIISWTLWLSICNALEIDPGIFLSVFQSEEKQTDQ